MLVTDCLCFLLLRVLNCNCRPYKLAPANDSDLAKLEVRRLLPQEHATHQEDGTGCLICSDELAEDAEVIALPACGHVFHGECIVKWLKMQAWCPVCRTSVVSKPAGAGGGGGANANEGEEKAAAILEPIHEDYRSPCDCGVAGKPVPLSVLSGQE